MSISVREPEWFEQLQNSLGIADRRAKEDFSLYFMSAFDRYDVLKESYIVRNASFLSNSIFITLSHATKPIKNPSGFGLALGSFIGFVEKAKDPAVCVAFFNHESTHVFLKKCLEIFKKIDGFDMQIIKDTLEDMDVSRLEPRDLGNYSSLFNSI